MKYILKLTFIFIISFIFTTHTSAETYNGGTKSTRTGKIIVWASNNIPSGYLLCNGQAVSRETYHELYKVIGTTYGSGDGSTTFNLPNISGRKTVGASTSTNVSNTGGSTNVTITSSNLPAHSHSIPVLSGTAESAGAHQHTVDPASTAAIITTLNQSSDSVTNRYKTRAMRRGYESISSGWFYDWGKGRVNQVASAGAHTHTVTTNTNTTGSSGSATTVSVQNPYIVVNYIIKF